MIARSWIMTLIRGDPWDSFGCVVYSVLHRTTDLTASSWLSFYPVHPAGILLMSETASFAASTLGLSCFRLREPLVPTLLFEVYFVL